MKVIINMHDEFVVAIFSREELPSTKLRSFQGKTARSAFYHFITELQSILRDRFTDERRTTKHRVEAKVYLDYFDEIYAQASDLFLSEIRIAAQDAKAKREAA